MADQTDNSTTFTRDTIAKCLVSLAALVILFLRRNVPGFQLDNLDIALLIVAALPWLQTMLRSAKIGGIEIEFDKVKSQQETQQSQISKLVEQEQKRQQEEIKLLQSLVVHTSISEYGISHLRNLASLDRTPYKANPDLERDIRRLLESALIARIPGQGIRTMMRDQGDIKDHFKITEMGRHLLAAWERIEEERSNPAP